MSSLVSACLKLCFVCIDCAEAVVFSIGGANGLVAGPVFAFILGSMDFLHFESGAFGFFSFRFFDCVSKSTTQVNSFFKM
jgi:hypothetical protein